MLPDFTKFNNIVNQVFLTEDYSEGFYKKMVSVLKPQAGHHITEEDLRAMIKRFNQLTTSEVNKQQVINVIQTALRAGEVKPKSGNLKDAKRVERLKNNPLDLANYNFSELDLVIHNIRTLSEIEKENKEKRNIKKGDTGAELISNHNGLMIYLGGSAEQCIKFKSYLLSKNSNNPKWEGVSGKNPYDWCIGWSGTAGKTNRWSYYRFIGESAYYVEDPSLPITNDHHVIVIHARQDGEFRLTDAFNGAEKIGNWTDVLQWQPKLKGAENIFKFIPYTEKEQLYKATKDASPLDFSNFTSHNIKLAYIQAGKTIFRDSYADLTADLQHEYINARAPNIEYINQPFIWRKLLDIFAYRDTSSHKKIIASINERIDKAQALAETTEDENIYLKPIFEDPTIKYKSKKNSTFKYWCKLVTESMDGVGAAMNRAKAAEQK
jgi:hypothetical protein